MKLKMKWSLILLFAFALVTGLSALFQSRAQASGWWRCVNPGGTNGCYTSIQAAINDSAYGDNINVWAGTYYEHITMRNGVSVYGAGWSQTVIDGNFSINQSTVYFPPGNDATTVLSGVRVSGGGSGNPNTSPNGGGILTILASPTIIDTFVYNNTGYWGGGVCVLGGSPTFTNVPAWINKGVDGGGYHIRENAVVTITRDITGADGTVGINSASDSGGGIYIQNATVTLAGLSVSSNTALNRGGGIYWANSTGSVQKNYLFGNYVTGTGSLGGGAFVTGSSNGVTLDHNSFESNSAVLAGGGLDLENGAVALVNANTIVTNTAEGGAGVSIYSAGVVTFTNNIVARNVTQATYPSGLNIYGTAARITNNTISDNSWLGIYFHTSNGIVIANNIISGNGMGIYRAEGTTPSYTADYNDVYNNSGGNYYNVALGAHDLSVNPGFIGSGNMLAYYHLQTTSAVGKSGSLAYAPPFDIDGELRMNCSISMGADQISCSHLYLPLIMR
jgi:parallel beta-helix repeat protein